MAKEQEKQIAKSLYFQGKTHKDIASTVKMSEHTIGKWVKQYNWKVERRARFNGHKEKIDNLKTLIGDLTDSRIELSVRIRNLDYKDDEEKKELQRKGSRLADEISKWSKALELLDKENRIPLTTHLEVMEKLFQAMNMHSPKLYQDSIEFQEEYLIQLTQNYK